MLNGRWSVVNSTQTIFIALPEQDQSQVEWSVFGVVSAEALLVECQVEFSGFHDDQSDRLEVGLERVRRQKTRDAKLVPVIADLANVHQLEITEVKEEV